MEQIEMKPSRPYLFRALFEWIVDNGLTPYIVVQTDLPDVSVPTAYISNNQIVLNIAPQSVKNYSVDEEAVSFNARFAGNDEYIYLPFYCLKAIYAKENGSGSEFAPEKFYIEQIQSLKNGEKVAVKAAAKKKNTSHLRIIK